MIVTDLDLPESARTQANLWKAKYFEALKELSNANKGIRRLRKQRAFLEECIMSSQRSYMTTIREMANGDDIQ